MVLILAHLSQIGSSCAMWIRRLGKPLWSAIARFAPALSKREQSWDAARVLAMFISRGDDKRSLYGMPLVAFGKNGGYALELKRRTSGKVRCHRSRQRFKET